jgi:hypothetical protein
MAAQFVGCHPRTITNTAKADPAFAERINSAETTPEFYLLSTVLDAGKQGTVHAAKWVLERLYPDQYRPRKPGTFSVDALRQLLVELTARLADQAQSDDERRRVLETIADFGKQIIVDAQPFVEHAKSLLSELSAAGFDASNDLPVETAPLPAEQQTPVSEPSQEDPNVQ